MPVLAAPNVDGQDHQNDPAHDELHDISAIAGIHQHVVQHVDGGKAQKDRHHRAPPGDKAAQAHDKGGQDEELHPDAGIGGDAVLAGGEQEPGQPDDQPRQRIGRKDRPLDRDPAVPRGLAVAAHGQHMPAKARLAEHDENRHGQHRQHPEGHRQGQHPFEPDSVPAVIHPRAGGDFHQLRLRGKGENPRAR